MFSKMDKIKISNTSLRVARMNANMDTGNLRYNAISRRIYNDGFSLIWNGDIADYWEYLETGTSKMQAYRIVTRTMFDVMIIMEEYSKTGNPGMYKDKYSDFKQRERAYADEKFGGTDKMMTERELQKQKSLLRAKGVIY